MISILQSLPSHLCKAEIDNFESKQEKPVIFRLWTLLGDFEGSNPASKAFIAEEH